MIHIITDLVVFQGVGSMSDFLSSREILMKTRDFFKNCFKDLAFFASVVN